METTHLCHGATMVSDIGYGYLALSKNLAEKYIPQDILKNIPMVNRCYRFNRLDSQHIAFFFCPFLSVALINDIYPKSSHEENLSRVKWINDGTIKAIKRYYPQILMDYPSALENLQKSVDKQYLL